MKLFLMMGQSNMAGRGNLAEVPEFPYASRIHVFNNAGEWVNPGAEPVDDCGAHTYSALQDTTAKAGPGMAFANRLCELRPEIDVGLIPCAKNGSYMLNHLPCWRPQAIYGATLARALEASVAGEIEGILWHQGESDGDGSSNGTTGHLWGNDFMDVIRSMRVDLGNLDLPVVFAQIGTSPSNTTYPGWNDIRARQGQILARRVVRVNHDDLAKQSDGIHLTTASYVQLGIRYAEAMHALI
jgi:hypothetical protein